VAVAKSRFRGPARVAVVADDLLRDVVALALNHGVFDTQKFESVEAAERAFEAAPPNLIIVDLDMLRGKPLSLIGRRLKGGGTVPSIALTVRGDIKSKLAAFDAGADDIVTVPISPEELVARVFALMRRTYGEVVQFVPRIRVRELEIDLLNQRVKAGTSRLHLTAIEQALLYLLASNPGRILTREQILDSLWGRDYTAESNVVDRHVRNLRVKLKDSWRRPRYIETVAGKGYRFMGPQSSADTQGL